MPYLASTGRPLPAGSDLCRSHDPSSAEVRKAAEKRGIRDLTPGEILAAERLVPDQHKAPARRPKAHLANAWITPAAGPTPRCPVDVGCVDGDSRGAILSCCDDGGQVVASSGGAFRDAPGASDQLAADDIVAFLSPIDVVRVDRERDRSVECDFGDLDPFVARHVLGTEIRMYPALVDRGPSVDLALLESKGAADVATRAGVRRLLVFATRPALSACAPRGAQAFAQPNGSATSRDEAKRLRRR